MYGTWPCCFHKKPPSGYQSQTITEFLLAAATAEARRVIHEDEAIELSQRDRLALAETLSNPSAASPRLKEAAERYRDGARR